MKKLRLAALTVSTLALVQSTAMPMFNSSLESVFVYPSDDESPKISRFVDEEIPDMTTNMVIVCANPYAYLVDPETVGKLTGPKFYTVASGKTGSFNKYGNPEKLTKELILEYAQQLEQKARQIRESAETMPS